jgi:HlyD family secretion protein
LALQQATLDYQKATALYNSKINPTESQLKQAQASLEQARANLARLTNPSANDLKSAQAAVDQARAARDLAQARIEDAILRAPFDGLATRVDFDLGSFVPAGRAIIVIADISVLQVKLNIDETDIARVQTGQEVTIGLDAYPNATLRARVSDVAATATTVQGVVNYVVIVSINPGDVPVKIGMTANANVVVARKENVLLVPNRAVRASSSKRFVTLLKSDGATQEVEVKLGLANDLETEVLSGLNEGQTLVVSFTQQNPFSGGPFGGSR